jgi:hypothetical protein
MKTLHVASTEIALDFNTAIKLATVIADNLIGGNMLLSS